MPVRVTLSDANGNVLDGFEVNTPNVVRYGNESISTIESSKGSFSYSKGFLRFDNADAVRNRLKSFEGQRFVRRKAVLMQLSKVIDELESRLFFLETKHESRSTWAKASTITPNLSWPKSKRSPPSNPARCP